MLDVTKTLQKLTVKTLLLSFLIPMTIMLYEKDPHFWMLAPHTELNRKAEMSLETQELSFRYLCVLPGQEDKICL